MSPVLTSLLQPLLLPFLTPSTSPRRLDDNPVPRAHLDRGFPAEVDNPRRVFFSFFPVGVRLSGLLDPQVAAT